MKSSAFVRGIRGPVGSGKSVCCAVELFRRALEQAPDDKGIRRTRWLVIRNTNPELKTTTIKTWLEWFPESDYGKFTWSPPYTHKIILPGLDMEVIFLALDQPDDVKKLLSLECTGVWVNEARELDKPIIDAVTMRVGRYPSMKSGGATWAGVIMDSNAMANDHWWPIMAGEAPLPEFVTEEEALMLRKPDNWEFYNQPPAMAEVIDPSSKAITGYLLNPARENSVGQRPGYYENMIRGKTKTWIDIYVMNRLGRIEDGKPVYPSFRRETHVSKETIEPLVGSPVYVGIDFGLTPAAVFAQRTARGRWLLIRELCATDMGIVRFADLIRLELNKYFPGFETFIYGDPAGDQRAQTDERKPFQILNAAGLRAIPTETNDPTIRIEAVTAVLNRMVDGVPGFLVSPVCKVMILGFESGYHYRRMQVSGSTRYEDRPNKNNKYSHPHDALQYLMLGAGEGRSLLRRNASNPLKSPMNLKRPEVDIFSRRSGVNHAARPKGHRINVF